MKGANYMDQVKIGKFIKQKRKEKKDNSKWVGWKVKCYR